MTLLFTFHTRLTPAPPQRAAFFTNCFAEETKLNRAAAVHWQGVGQINCLPIYKTCSSSYTKQPGKFISHMKCRW